MFSNISRYRKLPDVVTIDTQGRRLASKSLRLLPEATGTFLHTVEAGDRLDHLAYKYYKQSRKWWRICDANPALPSPQSLLGKEPLVTTRFPLTFAGEGQPLWADLLRRLGGTVGVEDIKVIDDIRLVDQEQPVDDHRVTVTVERHEQAVLVTHNQMNVSAGELAEAIAAAGFGVMEPATIGRIGKKIIIPPDAIG